jgi:hypothetical protein
LGGEGLVHSNSEPELRVADGLAIAINGSQLIGLHLPETVEWLDSGKCVNAEKLHSSGVVVKQAREDMCEHGLIKQARVKPQNDMLVRRCRHQFAVLVAKRL